MVTRFGKVLGPVVELTKWRKPSPADSYWNPESREPWFDVFYRDSEGNEEDVRSTDPGIAVHCPD